MFQEKEEQWNGDGSKYFPLFVINCELLCFTDESLDMITGYEREYKSG
jgi:hypothetical protein